MTKAHLRIVSGGSGASTRLFLVQEDGTEVDISSALKVRSLTINVSARELVSATIECLSPKIDIQVKEADLTQAGVPHREGSWLGDWD